MNLIQKLGIPVLISTILFAPISYAQTTGKEAKKIILKDIGKKVSANIDPKLKRKAKEYRDIKVYSNEPPEKKETSEETNKFRAGLKPFQTKAYAGFSEITLMEQNLGDINTEIYANGDYKLQHGIPLMEKNEAD